MPSSNGHMALLVTSVFVLCCSCVHGAAVLDGVTQVATCRLPASSMSDYGVGIVSDGSCNADKSIRPSSCLDTQCRMCQVFRSDLSKDYLPCSTPLLLALPVAVMGGIGTVPSDTTPAVTNPGPTPATTAPTLAPTPATMALTLAPTPATTAPTPTTTGPPPAPTALTPVPTAPTPAPTPATTAPTPAPTLDPTTPEVTIGSTLSVDPNTIDCMEGMYSTSVETGIYARLDNTCFDEFTTEMNEDEEPMTNCKNQFCRLCVAGDETYGDFYPDCSLFN